MSVFWHEVSVEAGCPTAGVLFNIKRNAKRRFKYAVCRLRRRKEFLIREKFACSFAARKKDRFWSEVRWLNHVKKSCVPSVDGICGTQHIADLFSSKFESLLNNFHLQTPTFTHPILTLTLYVQWFEDDVIDAICQLKSKKTGASGIISKHLKLSCSVTAVPLSRFLSSIERHGYSLSVPFFNFTTLVHATDATWFNPCPCSK